MSSMPDVSGSAAIRSDEAPVMAAAIEAVMPDAVQWVTVAASEFANLAIDWLARFWSSSMMK